MYSFFLLPSRIYLNYTVLFHELLWNVNESKLQIDYGIHVRGRLIDSAFTMHFDPRFDPLVEAVKLDFL